MSSRGWLAVTLVGAALNMGCAGSAPAAAVPTVKAGSMARFIAHDDYLYALNARELLVYEAVPGGSPNQVNTINVPAEAETLFPYGNLLFLGTRQGMLVYDVETPAQPVMIGEARHIYSCDPVVVQSDVAYVTLRAGSSCRQGVNALLVFDVSNPSTPRELGRLPMSSPRGLGVDGRTLFVADAEDGLLVLDVRDPSQPRLMGELPSIKGYDLIAHAGTLFVSADDGIYQYAYGPDGITRAAPLSRIPIGEEAVEIVAEPLKMAVDPAPPSAADPAMPEQPSGVAQ